MLTHVSSRCAGEVPSTKSSNEAASWQDLPCCVGWGTRHGSAGEGGMTMGEKVKQILDDILEKLPDQFNMVELFERVEDVTPYTGVFLQEIERMNALIFEMRRSLIELDSGLKGDLSITEPMEIMMNAMFTNKQPPRWEKLAWASRASLGVWLVDMLARYNQLLSWTGDLAQPKVSWISGFFNAQAFVTAVMQVACRKNDWPLNRVITTVDVTKKMTPEEVEGTARDGAYVYGLFMEGARWDMAAGCIEDAYMKELYPKSARPSLHACMQSRDLARCYPISPAARPLAVRLCVRSAGDPDARHPRREGGHARHLPLPRVQADRARDAGLPHARLGLPLHDAAQDEAARHQVDHGWRRDARRARLERRRAWGCAVCVCVAWWC